MSNILERIKMLVDNEKLSVRQFEKSIGASNGVISNALKKNTDIQGKWLSKIIYSYPAYNSEWLLTGNGEMLLEDERNSFVKDPEHQLNQHRSIKHDKNDENMQKTKDDFYIDMCKTKDTTIEALQNLVESQKRIIEQLEKEIKELTKNNGGQKRKAG